MLTAFHSYFALRIRRIFVIISLKIPPHLKCVATLPCEMSSVCSSVSLIVPLVSDLPTLKPKNRKKFLRNLGFYHPRSCIVLRRFLNTKACAYLCQHCCCIAGVGVYGEYLVLWYIILF